MSDIDLPPDITEQTTAFEKLVATWERSVTLVADEWGAFTWQVRRRAPDPDAARRTVRDLNLRWERLHALGYRRVVWEGKVGWIPNQLHARRSRVQSTRKNQEG